VGRSIETERILALGIEMLNELGYRVMTASDGPSALEILKRGNQVDLIFTDVVMPGGLTGVRLASEARLLHPNIKVLLTSGYTGEALARHQTETMPLIEKPFRQGELARKLREILGDSSANNRLDDWEDGRGGATTRGPSLGSGL